LLNADGYSNGSSQRSRRSVSWSRSAGCGPVRLLRRMAATMRLGKWAHKYIVCDIGACTTIAYAWLLERRARRWGNDWR
jgi:hypothetical protein